MTTGHQYALDVISGKQVAGKLIQLAAKRFISDMERTDIYFDEAEATKFTNFAENHLLQWEGSWEGNPIKFEPWQNFVFEQLFGWIRTDNGRRRFTKLYLQIAKKNGKSTICAALSLFHLFADERINTPKVFTAANNEDQAKICVNMAGQMVKKSPDLFEFVEDGEVNLFTYKENVISLVHNERNGFIKALSKESSDKNSKTAGGKHGINASLGLVDEFGMSPDQGASGTISSSMASRLERLMAYLTTAGFNLAGPCYTGLRDQGIKVLEGVLSMDNYLPIIFEIDRPIGDDGKPKDVTLKYLKENEHEWIKANPNLGISVNKEYLREAIDDGISLGSSTETNVLTLNFNCWQESAEVWIPKDTWEINTHGFTKEDLIGRQCYGSIQIISQRELGVFTLLFPNIKPDVHAVLPIFWAPESFISEHKNDTNYQKWVDDGDVLQCFGNVVDNSFIFDSIISEIRKYQLISASVPVNMEKHDIVQSLANEGIEFNPISQGFKVMSEPTFAWEGLLTAGKIEHFNNPVLRWTNSNCMVKRNGDDIKLERNASRTAGIVCAINALAQWKGNDGKQDETDDFFFVNTTRKK
jgi:phage terminase large subunit-like protein